MRQVMLPEGDIPNTWLTMTREDKDVCSSLLLLLLLRRAYRQSPCFRHGLGCQAAALGCSSGQWQWAMLAFLALPWPAYRTACHAMP